MVDALRLATEVALASPWLLVVITALAVVDALLPVVPSEALIIAAGVASAAGEQDLLLVIAAAGFGAFLGEVTGYTIGRGIGPGLRTRLRPDSARARTYDTGARLLAARGGTVLLTARFIPAGRTIATMTAGATGYRSGPFLAYTAAGALLSAAYVAVLGFLGGTAFAQDTLMALLFSFGLAVTVGLLVEAGRRILTHHHREAGKRRGRTRDRLCADASTTPTLAQRGSRTMRAPASLQQSRGRGAPAARRS